MAIKRIQKELLNFYDETLLTKNSSKAVFLPIDPYSFRLIFILDSKDYENGLYIGNIKFPQDYPFKPPKYLFENLIHPYCHQDGTLCCQINDAYIGLHSPRMIVQTTLDDIIKLIDINYNQIDENVFETCGGQSPISFAYKNKKEGVYKELLNQKIEKNCNPIEVLTEFLTSVDATHQTHSKFLEFLEQNQNPIFKKIRLFFEIWNINIQDFTKNFSPIKQPQNNQNNPKEEEKHLDQNKEEFKAVERKKSFEQKDPPKNNDQQLIDILIKNEIPKENSITLIDFQKITIDFNSLLGKGGSALIYKGKWNGIDVAIKEINNLDINDKKEVEALAKEISSAYLNHPMVNRIYGICFQPIQNKIYVIKELADEGSLLSKMNKKLDLDSKLQIAKSLVTIMEYLQNNNIIHRDIKPSNFLINRNVIQIADFETAKIAFKQDLTTQNQKYTPKYAAPEVILEKGFVGFYSDIWSLGCVLYQLFYEQKPWSHYKMNQIVISMVKEELFEIQCPKNVEITQEIQNAVKGCLRFDHTKRVGIEDLQKTFG